MRLAFNLHAPYVEKQVDVKIHLPRTILNRSPFIEDYLHVTGVLFDMHEVKFRADFYEFDFGEAIQMIVEHLKYVPQVLALEFKYIGDLSRDTFKFTLIFNPFEKYGHTIPATLTWDTKHRKKGHADLLKNISKTLDPLSQHYLSTASVKTTPKYSRTKDNVEAAPVKKEWFTKDELPLIDNFVDDYYISAKKVIYFYNWKTDKYKVSTWDAMLEDVLNTEKEIEW